MANDAEAVGPLLAVSLTKAGQLIGVSRWCVRSAIADGRLPAVRLGRRIVVSIEALKRFVNEGAA